MLRRSKRFFISQHPTFVSYKSPAKQKVEQSLYYWWWYALTLNTCYTNLCAKVQADKNANNGKGMYKVYNDFGDVRYEGDRHKAFCDWWRAKVNEHEEKGVYLFAEPITAKTVELIEDAQTAKQVANDASSLLIQIPKNIRRTDIDRRLNFIFERELEFERGRKARDVKRSNARYSVGTAVKVENIKTAFKVYELVQSSEKLSNYKIAKRVGIEVGSRTKDEATDIAYERRKIGIAVTRKKKIAVDIINNVGKGKFA